MVICAACKQYTDDSQAVCRQCGAPLEEDTQEEVRSVVGLRPEVAELAADRGRAVLVASGVVAQYLPNFFYEDDQRRTVLVELFGSPLTPWRAAAGLLFSSVVYLIGKEYCTLEPIEGDKGFRWQERKPWRGQLRSLEGSLAAQAGLGLTVREAIDEAVQEWMGFDFEITKPSRLSLPGVPKRPPVRDLSDFPAQTAVLETARQTALPTHEENAACAEIYRMLNGFVRTSPQLARYLAEEIREILEWFRQYDRDPTLALTRAG
jgi:RNA polymerase subunit RPABC4/transcription elongation factor Spt4